MKKDIFTNRNGKIKFYIIFLVIAIIIILCSIIIGGIIIKNNNENKKDINVQNTQKEETKEKSDASEDFEKLKEYFIGNGKIIWEDEKNRIFANRDPIPDASTSIIAIFGTPSEKTGNILKDGIEYKENYYVVHYNEEGIATDVKIATLAEKIGDFRMGSYVSDNEDDNYYYYIINYENKQYKVTIDKKTLDYEVEEYKR